MSESRINTKPRNKRRTLRKNVYANAAVNVAPKDSFVLPEDLFAEADESGITQGEKWIRFFDTESNFLKGLYNQLNNSFTLRSIIDSKSQLITGNGFIVQRGRAGTLLKALRRVWEKISGTDSELEKIDETISSVNLDGENLEDVFLKAAYDFEAFGNCVCELVRVEAFGNEPKKLYIYHHQLHTVGIRPVDKDGRIKKYGIGQNFQAATIGKDEEVDEIPLYPTWIKRGKTEHTLIHVKRYAPGFKYWGLPSWIAARMWAEIEYRIPKYNVTKFKNGYVPSAIVQLFGAVSQKEGQEMKDSFIECFTDSGNNHKLFLQVLRDERYAAKVNVLEDKNDGNYMDLSKLASQALVTATRWTMSLAGFATSGKLGSNQQMREEFKMVKKSVIDPARRTLMNRIFNVYIKEAGAWTGEFEQLHLSVVDIDLFGVADNIDASTVMTVDEQRMALGLEQLDEDQRTQLTAKNKPSEKTEDNAED